MKTTAIEQPKYTPVYKPKQVVCGTGRTVIVTGWTVAKFVAKRLEPQEYAGIGNLYSPTRGISFLLRNLLANPQIRYLVVMQATKEDKNAGGSQCLLDFFANGFVEGISDTGCKCWVINSEIKGHIDFEIPETALNDLRRYISCREATSLDSCIAQVKAIEESGYRLPPWNLEPLIFPVIESTPTVLPGRRYGHLVEGKTIAETWVKIIQRIKTTGTIRPSAYDDKWQELIDLVAVVTDEPEDFYFPEPNYLPCDRAFLENYIPQILDDAPKTEGVKYTYGQRLRSWFDRDQIEQVVHKIAKDPDSARAVMSLWDVKDHDDSSPPCLNHIWVRVVDKQLSLTATFRSNDMFTAWVSNAMGLRALQMHIRDRIAEVSTHHLTLGPLITISQSAHIYGVSWDHADRVIEQQYPKICKNRDYSDPAGSFSIAVVDGGIVAEHLTPGSGEVVDRYCGKCAVQLYQSIATKCPGIEAEHAFYLGTELQKAETAIKLSLIYEQDKPLSTDNLWK